MDNPPATNLSRSPLVRLWPWLVVLLAVLFVGFIRFRLLDMPLERDEGEYAYAGQLILQGIPPYELAYNMKLPGTYYAYALGMAVFGKSIAGIHATLIVTNSLTIIFIFLLARKLFGTTAGLVACASYGVMSASPAVLGLAAHANHFVVLFAVPATLLLWKANQSDETRTWFFSGLLYGLAFLMKQQGIWFCIFGCGFLVWRAVAEKSFFSATFARRGLVFTLGIILPFALFCILCLVAGDFDRFWFWTFTYARWYATMLPASQGLHELGGHLQQTLKISLGFWAMALIGLPLALRSKSLRGPALFAAVFWIFSFLGTATGLYFRSHYFILLLPAFAILVGASVGLMQQMLCFTRFQNYLKGLPVILFAAIFSWAVFYQRQILFQLPTLPACEIVYPLNPFAESLAAGDYIREHSAPDARVAVIGSEPQIYFYAQRHSATGYIYTYPLMERQPAASAMQREMIREIESNHPEFLVFVANKYSWLLKDSSDQTILSWFGKYSGAFYDIAGIINTSNDGKTMEIWGDEAKNYHGPLDQYLAIYKRKPDAGTIPAK